jgi:hypothetical protein
MGIYISFFLKLRLQNLSHPLLKSKTRNDVGATPLISAALLKAIGDLYLIRLHVVIPMVMSTQPVNDAKTLVYNVSKFPLYSINFDNLLGDMHPSIK